MAVDFLILVITGHLFYLERGSQHHLIAGAPMSDGCAVTPAMIGYENEHVVLVKFALRRFMVTGTDLGRPREMVSAWGPVSAWGMVST